MNKKSHEKRKVVYRPSSFGRNKEMIESKTDTITGKVTVPPVGFDWNNAIIDGTIIAFLTFFTTLTGTALVGETVDITNILLSAAISAIAQFFVILAIKRGLRAPQ